MLSRVANSLFWLARYMERAENSARFILVTHGYAQELRGVFHGAADQCWTVASTLLGGSAGDAHAPMTAFYRLALDTELPTSVLSSVARARENARGIRDAISSEMWEELNVLHLRLQEESGSAFSESSQLSLLNRVMQASHLYQGLRDNTMRRGDEWHFLLLGQLLERGDMTGRLLRVMFNHPALQAARGAGHSIDTLHLAATLRACTGLEAYARSGPGLTAHRVAEFLLLDAAFPRSVEFCVQEIGRSLHVLSGTPQDIFSNEAEQLCGRLVAELRFAGIDEIMLQGLSDYLQRMLQKLDRLGRAISQEYFR